MDKNKVLSVTNRSGMKVIYTIPSINVRRTFAPGQTLSITYGELEQLTFQPGGNCMITEYLYIKDPEVADSDVVPNPNIDPEYYYTDEDVIELILNTKNDPDNMDKFLDALDFGVEGVKELIKKYAVELPCNDVRKREALKEKLHFNVDLMIANGGADAGESTAEKKTRRVKTNAGQPAETASNQPKRRVKKSAE